jgi:hypothetical protein
MVRSVSRVTAARGWEAAARQNADADQYRWTVVQDSAAEVPSDLVMVAAHWAFPCDV